MLIDAGTAKVDLGDFATISSVRVRYEIDGVSKCRTLGGQAKLPPRMCGCKLADDEDTCPHDIRGMPDSFEVVNDQLCLSPIPDSPVTVEVDGYRNVNCELFTINDDGVRVWNEVDLPPNYQTVFANLVLSKSFAEAGDFNAAAYWQQTASTGLDSLVQKAENRFDPDAGHHSACQPAEFKLIQRGARRDCDDKACCDEPEMEQILVEKVYVDCDGLPILDDDGEPEFAPTGKGGRLERVT